MKFKYYSLLTGLLFFLVSCEKDLENVTTPTFDVSTASTTYKVGDKIKFDITGEANIVSFYSGETLKEFAYRDGRIVDATGKGATLSFSTSVTGGTQGLLSATVPPQLEVKVSTKFNGNYTLSDIQSPSAEWTDITSSFKYSQNGTALGSGVKDISDLIVAGKPIYFAFRYVTKPQAVNGTARNWKITAFSVNSKANISVSGPAVNPNVVNQFFAGFRLIDQNPVTAPIRSSLTNTIMSLWGNLYDPVNDPGNDPQSEHWAISRPISVNSIDLGGDKGVSIKEQMKTVALKEHIYTYTQPGIYKATFVALNVNLHNRKEIVKEITITVTP